MAAKETVSVKTFKKWPFSKYFDYMLDDDNRIEEIKRQLHGSVLSNVKQCMTCILYTYINTVPVYQCGNCLIY